MKAFISVQLAAAGILSLAPLAKAQSFCAITCFQNVITEYPPLDCTEENMYLCFCKAEDLQGYFIDCVYDDCASEADEAVAFGVNLCSELGAPITVPPRPDPTTATTGGSEPTPDSETTTTDTVDLEPTPTEISTASETEDPIVPAPTEPSGDETESGFVSETAAHTASQTVGGNSTAAPSSEPSHVEVGMATNMMVAPGLLTAAAAVVAALQLF